MVDVCEVYGFTPNEVGELTVYQLRMLAAKREHLGGTLSLPANQARQMLRGRGFEKRV